MSNSYEEVKTLRRTIVSMAYKAGEGHIASALSVLDILYVLYSGVVVHDPSNPHWEGRDYVMLSKGHGCLALYAVLANQGYFQYDLSTFCKYSSPFGGHPNRNKVPGVENSSGSLGHGLPIAVGIAKGLKIKRLPNRVFCIVGDGELSLVCLGRVGECSSDVVGVSGEVKHGASEGVEVVVGIVGSTNGIGVVDQH